MDSSFRYTISSENTKNAKNHFLYIQYCSTRKFRKMHSFPRCCNSNKILLNEMDKTSRKRYWGQTYVIFCVLLLMNIIMA
ncbi:hypothetical protein HanIR_Chr05g0241921 [Helianthus annuus]|nr:hypothetical protein HanIR_Chr05g0241921 [Helianthus annuus]